VLNAALRQPRKGAQAPLEGGNAMTITHINPDALHKNPAFSQAVLVEGGRTLYIGEQNGVDATGALVAGGARAEAIAALEQIKLILAEVGADQSNVVKMSVYYPKETSFGEIFAAAGEAWGNYPTAITVLQVHAMGREGALVGIEAIASV
jgi:enamine deaminase RidA (YjgF/YER057c/UK114 family)